MIGPRAGSADALRVIFRGWPSVDVYYDPGAAQHVIRLVISDRAVAAACSGFDGAAALIDRLAPKKVRKPVTGVRYHGRIVGRRV